MMPLVFAYGSNMYSEQMEVRCPSAKAMCIATLMNHRLVFTRNSRNRNCGVADVIPEPGSTVWGVLYQITEGDLNELDKCDGFKQSREAQANAYNRRTGTVFPGDEGGQPLEVQIYIANKHPGAHFPNRKYIDLILRGAKEHGIPEEYIRNLEKIPVEA